MKRKRLLLLVVLVTACAGGRPRPSEETLETAQRDLASGHADDAQRGFELVLLRDPTSLPAIRGRIEAARKRGGLGLVASELQLRAEARPGDAVALYALGLARFAQGDDAAALVALRRAADLRPSEPDIQYRLGLALFSGEKFAEAKAPLSRAVELAPKVVRYRVPLATCLGRLGERRAAIAALGQVPLLGPTPEEAALAVKSARALTDLFRDLPQPARADLEVALGYLTRDAPGLAVPPLEALLQRFPDLAPAHALLGLAAARLDEAGKAVTELKRAAELAPELPQPHAWLAELYSGKERAELAAGEYALALERDPLDVETLIKLGRLRLESAPAQALSPLAQAAALAPEDDALQLLLARAQLGAGKPEQARPLLERLADKRPEDAEVLLRLALLLFDDRARLAGGERRALTTRVEQLLDRVLALQPENATASRLLTALKSG